MNTENTLETTSTTLEDIAQQKPLAKAIQESIPQDNYVMRGLYHQHQVTKELMNTVNTAGKSALHSIRTSLKNYANVIGNHLTQRRIRKDATFKIDDSYDTVFLGYYKRRKK